jgi:hypothetical protein
MTKDVLRKRDVLQSCRDSVCACVRVVVREGPRRQIEPGNWCYSVINDE